MMRRTHVLLTMSAVLTAVVAIAIPFLFLWSGTSEQSTVQAMPQAVEVAAPIAVEQAVSDAAPVVQDQPAAGTARIQTKGKLTLLRVHNVGTGYGPDSDKIDVEVVIWLDTRPGQAFGFTLREDTNRVAHAAMLDLLRDAFNNDYTITVEYDIDDGKNNGKIVRVWLSK